MDKDRDADRVNELGFSEQQLRAIIDGQPNGMVMIDRNGKIVLVNIQLLSDFQYSREELLGQSIEILLPKRFRSEHPTHRNSYFANPSIRAMGAGRDLYGLRKDGSEFPVELGLNPIRTDEGMFVVGSVVDITQRKSMDDELEKRRREASNSERRLKLILDGQPNGMVMINRDGEIVMVNKQLEVDFGYSRDEMMGHKIELLLPSRFRDIHPHHRDVFLANPTARAMGAGRDLFGQRKDGSEFPVELGLNPITIGEETFVLSSVVDITERKAAEQKLQTLATSLEVRNHDIRVLLDGVEQGFFTITSDGTISEERSGALDRWFGAPTPGMTIVEFIAQFDPEPAFWIELGLDQVFSEIIPVEAAIAQMPNRFVHGVKTYAIDFTPIRVEKQLCLAVAIRDITSDVEKEELEIEQREILAMVTRIAKDRAGFVEFYHEADGIVKSLRNDLGDDIRTVKRRVHTLKGNTGIYGLVRTENICHQLEEYISEEEGLPPEREWEKLFDAWRTVQGNMQNVMGSKSRFLEVTEAEYNRMLVDILGGKPHSDLAVRLAAWKLEPTACYLDRIAEQARALGERLGKSNVRVTTRDEDLRIEAANWAEFWSSFIHVVRNAIDHGLESPAERIAAGKPAQGTIELVTEVFGDQFQIVIRDDGRGIDWRRVSELAAAKGLPAATQSDLCDALFCDGLSTAATVTATSGRGIGMMAVKSSCERLGGKITVDSQSLVGTTIRFRFPVQAMAPHTTGLLRQNEFDAIQACRSSMFAVRS